ncbi:MAG: RNA polymerase sigma factor [Anaerolineae bacterium]|nr:RNA polymerase sigma factor [Anaerolineae bacterium]
MTATEEIVLITRAQDGDRIAFATLVREHSTRLYRIAFALLGNHADAEDVVQEAFIAAYRSLRGLKKRTSFEFWLNSIVVNRARDLLRKRKRDRELVSQMAENMESLAERERFSDLYEAIGSLPCVYRLVILLYYGEGYNTGEIARSLDRPAGTVRRMLSEARQMLREYLKEK